MYDRLEIFQIANGLARNASARQAQIAGNVANADTPGYRARSIAPFAETYRASETGTGLRATRPGHSGGAGSGATDFQIIDRPGPTSPNGNTVSIENEMMQGVDVRFQYEMALSVYQTSLNILRISIGRG